MTAITHQIPVAQPLSSWTTIGAYALASSAALIMQLTFAPITTVAAERYGVSVAAIGWLGQVFSILYVVFAVPMGMALDRKFRKNLAVGVILTFLGAVLRVVDETFAWALAGQIVAAVGQPLVLNGIAKLAANYLAAKDRPLGIALCAAGQYAGQLIAVGLGTLFPEPEQVSTVLHISAAYSAVVTLAMLICLRRPGAYHGSDETPAGFATLRAVWADSFVRTLAVLVFAGMGIVITYMTWLEALLQPAGVSPESSGVILLSMIVAGILGAALLPAWVAKRHKEYTLFFVSCGAATLGSILLSLIPGFVTGLITMTLLGLLQLSALPIILEFVERRTGPAAATATAIVWMAGNAGVGIISMAVQSLIENPSTAFLLLASMSAMTLPLILVLQRQARMPGLEYGLIEGEASS